jgi:hypothetical protein
MLLVKNCIKQYKILGIYCALLAFTYVDKNHNFYQHGADYHQEATCAM